MPDYRLGRLGGEFVVVWYGPDGRRHRWRLGATTPVEARAALREFTTYRERLRRPSHQITVAEIWADYVAEKEAQGKVSTGRIKDAWKALAPYFAQLAPSEISGSATRNYIGVRRARASDGTIHTELGYLRAALRWAVKAGRLVSAQPIVLPPKPRPRSRHLTPDEARRLIDAAQMPHVRLFILLALHTAARPSSLLDLTWDRVASAKRVLRLDNPARDRTAKGRATVPISEAIVKPLEKAKEAALTNYVIEWAGKPVKSIKKGFAEACRRAGLKGVTPYVLRHTAAVWMAEAGVPMEEIAQFMGHTSPAVTFRTYARFSPEHLRRASDAISTALQGPPNRKP